MPRPLDELTRRQVRYYLFLVRDQREFLLNQTERDEAQAIWDHFNGYLIGAIGWADFSFKWDVHPDEPLEIMSKFDWHNYLEPLVAQYGSEEQAILRAPPAFTHQERLDGGEAYIRRS